MWLPFLIVISEACDVRIDEINIYPTQGENYILPMDTLFSGRNLSYFCQNCPNNLILYNTFETIVSKDNYGFTTKSIDSNKTHFAVLTYEQTLNIYNNDLDLVSNLQLTDGWTYFNAIYTINNEVLLNCYNQNVLQFLFQKQNKFVSIQKLTSPTPMKTKMRSFITQKKEALLYAQFYAEYSTLTLFIWEDDHYKNTSEWQHQILDFDISDKGFIYILVPNVGIYQAIIDKELKFSVPTMHLSPLQLLTITIGTSVTLNSQLDILIITSFDYGSSVQKYVAWENSIYFFGDFILTYFDFSLYSTLQVQISQYFLIIQQDNYFTVNSAEIIYQSQNRKSMFTFSRNTNDITQIYSYLDPATNRLYEFSNKLTVSTIQNPQLKGIFDLNISKGHFSISAFEIELPFLNRFCRSQITFNLLPKNDTNIYQVYNQKLPKVIMQNSIVQYAVDSFSGPLQKINANISDPKLGKFDDETFELLNVQIDQEFDLVKLFYVTQLSLEGLILVGVQDLTLYIYICQSNYTCMQVYNNIFNQKIHFIEISFYYLSNFTVAINQGSVELILIQANYDEQLFGQNIAFSETVICCQPFEQFLLTYKNLVLLTPDKRIIITTFNQDVIFSLDEEIVNQLFYDQIEKRLEFNPKSIITNQLNLASIFFINNRDNFIIIDIAYNNSLIPISITFVNYEIYSLNLVNEQIVVSNLLEDDMLEFEVYKIYNILKPEFQKQLPPLQILRGVPIYSDDAHLYVRSQANYMVVYSPALPYHSTQYFRFKFTGNYFSCIDLNYTSYVTFSNKYYLLHVAITEQFISSNVINATYISELTQIFAVSSALNVESKQYFDDTIYIINPLIDIEVDSKNLTYQFQKAEHFRIDLDFLFNFQILKYDLQTNEQDSKQSSVACQLYPYFQGQQNYSFPNFTIVLNVNNEFYLQSNTSILGVQSGVQTQYLYQFQKCMASASYQNKIYTICISSQITFLIQFEISGANITQLFGYAALPLSCQVIKKMVQFQNLTFVLGQNVISSKYEYIYVYNLYNLSNITVQNVSCKKGIEDFAVQYLYNQTQSEQIIAIFFICDNALYYNLGYLNQINYTLHLDKDFQNVILKDKKLLILKQTAMLQIIPLALKYNEILLALTTTNATTFIFTMTFSKDLYVKKELQLQTIVQTIPPYGNYTQQYFGLAMKGILLLLFAQQNERVFAVYNYTKIQSNIREPLMMMGGLNQSLPNPQGVAISIVSNKLGGQIVDLTNGSLNIYNFTSSNYLTCQSTQRAHNDQYYSLSLYNSFSSDTIELIFQYKKEGPTYWIYILLAMVILSVLSFVYVYRQKMKDHRYFFEGEEELTDEFEL
ncbi:unnamed protein product (macronuclear) [Paramecium tetraurelia]|uniref:Transmembrane protein n=1 Tax=Paramecium tetraurelia TaxID=5888 RepID=A0BDI9_PARTE|nr:uncharacterized protein GSPATT00027635001 [Paramecium tetraurelia]CAK56606.1 unnamed protein product [Paramecium tetraurelia]|eukprot:XP_001424004.1 hypothetical protein (macronuclear) [Paramecium tetraurelia strain d4-2]